MNRRFWILLQLAGCIAVWLGLSEWQDRIVAAKPSVAAAQRQVSKLQALSNGTQWEERRSLAADTRKQWESALYQGASLAEVKSRMMDHYTELLITARVNNYNVSLADKPFSEKSMPVTATGPSLVGQPGMVVITATFSGSFNADSVTHLVSLLAEDGRLVKLESVVVNPTRFELVIKLLANIQEPAQVSK